MKKQGYNARLDESLGARNKTKGKQSLKSRRKESEGMEKSKGRRKYSAVGTMDKGATKKTPARQAKKGTSKGKRWERNTLGDDLKEAPGKVARKAGKVARKVGKGLSKLIPQHKRMAMGEDVVERKAGGRAPSPTAVNLNMGEPKTKTITARGMGAATRGGQFREVV
jgi:hypothetical protein